MRLLGGAMVTLGVLAFWAPMATGGWSLALLSFPLVALQRRGSSRHLRLATAWQG